MGPIGNAYRGCRERIVELVSGLGDDEGDTAVPACPAWTVHDVVAHLAGTMTDAVEGRLNGAATAPWTARQLEERKGMTIAEIVAEWNEKAPLVEPVMDQAPGIGVMGVADITSHEHDIRGALNRPGARDSASIPIALAFAVPQVVEAAGNAGTKLRVVTDGAVFGAEEADADVTLTAEPWELLRAATGRRSVEQIRRLQWDGDWKAALPGFWWMELHPAAAPIEE